MKQTLKIGAMLLVVAALAMTGVAVALAQSGDEVSAFQAGTDQATTVEESPLHSKIVEWLAPLVDEGTIDQDQAEAVADTLVEAMPSLPGRLGPVVEAVRGTADLLGLTPAEVGEAVRDGQTLAEIAVANGSTAEALIDHLTGLAEERIDELVADGRITEEQKAEMLDHLTDRITDLVNGELAGHMMGGPGRGHLGQQGGDGSCMDDDTELEELGA